METIVTKQSLYPAQEADQRRIAAALAGLKAQGWTRPMFRQLSDDLTDYAVWRAQHGKVRVNEVQLWVTLIAHIKDGSITRPLGAAADRRNRVTKALEILDRVDDARSVRTIRELVDEARDVLRSID